MQTTLKLCLLVLPFLLACTRVGRPTPERPLPPQKELENTVPNPESSSEIVKSPEIEFSGWEADLLVLVNDIRKKGCRCGRKRMSPVASLSLDLELNEAAQVHANDMFKNEFFDHTGSDGTDVGDRATKVGFRWSAIGENISWNYPNTQAVFEGWLNSKGHCMNMMSPNFRKMGAAKQGPYWVQTFGTKR